MHKLRLCYVVASEITVAAFLSGHIKAMAQRYEVCVAGNIDNPDALGKLGLSATLLPVPIERRVALWRDLIALFALYRHFRRGGGFDLVHSVSPKAGILGMLAAWLARVPRRVHTFTGQVWVTRRGWRRVLLKAADRMLAALATDVLVDSPSQRDFLIAEGVLGAGKSRVIGKGSICGVDGGRFRPDADARCGVRTELGIPPDATVLLFLGRLNRDKGVADLAVAFAAIAGHFPDARLLLVGPDEEGMVAHISSTCSGAAARVHHVGYTRQPERFMAASDIFSLPSYREGFGMVVIEAAAVGLPAVASRIYGITDAVIDQQTGLLHPAGDVQALARALIALLSDPARRSAMGECARSRALADFSQAESSRELLAFYGKILV